MAFVQNFPFFCILLALITAVVTSVLSSSKARLVTLAMLTLSVILNAAVMLYTLRTGESYVYLMGHFPAPWGNEIRAGILETVSATLLSLVVLLSFIGGDRDSRLEIDPWKYNLFCILVDLTLLSMLALIYTNDLFTGYVFIEINTLAAAGLVVARQDGKSLVASVRYMIMNLLGSSLFLIGVVLIYTITGHLLMVPIREQIAKLAVSEAYWVPLTVVVSLIGVGLGMKSALYPFEKWLPGAYGNATPTAAALLSSIVSKGYIFLLIKVLVRVIGLDVVRELGICNVLFIFGAVGMIMGSVNAIRSQTTKMMVAYSSVAQIGYIFLALGIGTQAGMVAALFHTLSHSAAKAMLFLSSAELDHASGETGLRRNLRGGFYRAPEAAVCFTIGSFSLVGVPFLPIFVSKLLIGQAAIAAGGVRMMMALACLTVSTVLNVLYFMVTAVTLYLPDNKEERRRPDPALLLGMVGLAVLNIALGLGTFGLVSALNRGIMNFM